MITVFGSLNVDLILPVERLPVAGETVIGGGYSMAAGGKGANQALAARRAGAEVRMAGAVGRDGFAEIALAELETDGVDVSRVARVDTATGAAFIAVDGRGQNQILVAAGANREARAAQLEDAALRAGDTLLLQMEVPAAENGRLLARAKSRGLRTILNLAPALEVDRATLASLDWLVVNEIEVATAATIVGGQTGTPEAAARHLALNGIATVVTCGAKGALAIGPDEAWRIDALAIDPIDSTGAGDAFTGVFAAGLDRGDGVAEALRWASVAGGLACLERGAQPSLPWRSAIEARLSTLPAARRV